MAPIFRIDLYNKGRVWQAPVGAFINIAGTQRFDNISDCEFTVKATHKRLGLMLTPGTRARIQLRGETIVHGPIRGHSSFGPGVSGEFTFRVEDNFRILRNFLIYQVPGAPATDQAAAYNYRVAGNAETVIKDLVTKNITNRHVEPVTVGPNLNRGGFITSEARMAKIYNELFPLLESMGLGVKVTSSPAGLLVDVYEPGVYPNPLTEQSRVIRKWKHSLEAPDVTAVIVGGQGDGTARRFIGRNNPARQALWGDRIEEFRDAQDAELTETYHERAEETLFDGRGTAQLEVTLGETNDFKLGGPKGLKVGQRVTAKVANGLVEITDILRELEFSWNAEDGLKITGQIGQVVAPSRQMANAISTLGGSLAKLKASK